MRKSYILKAVYSVQITNYIISTSVFLVLAAILFVKLLCKGSLYASFEVID